MHDYIYSIYSHVCAMYMWTKTQKHNFHRHAFTLHICSSKGYMTLYASSSCFVLYHMCFIYLKYREIIKVIIVICHMCYDT